MSDDDDRNDGDAEVETVQEYGLFELDDDDSTVPPPPDLENQNVGPDEVVVEAEPEAVAEEDNHENS